jgi:hypothetical protein
MRLGFFVAAPMAAAFLTVSGWREPAKAEETPPLVCTRTKGAWTKVSGPEGKDCSALKHRDASVPIDKTCGREGDCSVEALLPRYNENAPHRLKVRKGAAGVSQHSEKEGLDDIRAQFFYQTTGTLSQNVAPPAKFTIHNAVIGEGDLKEPADDLLVSVFFFKLGENLDGHCDHTLTIVVTDDKNNIVLLREFNSPYLTVPGYKEIVSTPLGPPAPVNGRHLLQGVRAALFSNFPTGRVKIEAMFGDDLLAVWLFFGDGE